MRESRTSERRLAAVDRQCRALELRKASWTYPQIADHLGMSLGNAHKSVQVALRKTLQEPADELRAMMLEQHRTMVKTIWPAVLRGDLRAIDRAIRILAAIADLEGLNAPIKVDVRRIVAEVAAEFGLEPHESAALIDDVTGHLATTKPGR